MQEQQISRFAVVSGFSYEQKTIAITRSAAMVMLEEARVIAHQPEVVAAREIYIGHIENFLQLNDQLEGKLAVVEAAFKVADDKFSEVYKTLEEHIRQTNTTSTTGSVVSIIGVVLLFNPVTALFGAGMTIGGALTTVGSSVAQTFLFDRDASKVFGEILNNYLSSTKALEDLIKEIEKTKELLTESLTIFLSLAHTYPFPNPPRVTRPNIPGRPALATLDAPHVPNLFSTVASRGIALRVATGKPLANVSLKGGAEIAAVLARNGAKLLVKALSLLSKAVPVIGIFVDVTSIVTTWTNTNETSEQVKKLKGDIFVNVEAFRQAVRGYRTGLEEQIGSAAVRDSLRKLLRLRRPPPPPPLGPEDVCKILELMQSMKDVGFLLFANLQGDDHKDPIEAKYAAEIVPSADVHQFSQMAMCAPVVDSVYERYPYDRASQDEQDVLQPAPPVGSRWFRDQSRLVHFHEEYCFNRAGSRWDNRGSPWIGFWRWFMVQANLGGCSEGCKINIAEGWYHPDFHDVYPWPSLGGHMELYIDNGWDYILPICSGHNAPAGFHDRAGGRWMRTKKTAYAVEIDPR